MEGKRKRGDGSGYNLRDRDRGNFQQYFDNSESSDLDSEDSGSSKASELKLRSRRVLIKRPHPPRRPTICYKGKKSNLTSVSQDTSESGSEDESFQVICASSKSKGTGSGGVKQNAFKSPSETSDVVVDFADSNVSNMKLTTFQSHCVSIAEVEVIEVVDLTNTEDSYPRSTDYTKQKNLNSSSVPVAGTLEDTEVGETTNLVTNKKQEQQDSDQQLHYPPDKKYLDLEAIGVQPWDPCSVGLELIEMIDSASESEDVGNLENLDKIVDIIDYKLIGESPQHAKELILPLVIYCAPSPSLSGSVSPEVRYCGTDAGPKNINNFLDGALKSLRMINFMRKSSHSHEIKLTEDCMIYESRNEQSTIHAILLLLGQDDVVFHGFGIKPSEYVGNGSGNKAVIEAIFKLTTPDLRATTLKVKRIFENSYAAGVFRDSKILVQYNGKEEEEINLQQLKDLVILTSHDHDFLIYPHNLNDMFNETEGFWWRRFKRNFDESLEVADKNATMKALMYNLKLVNDGVETTKETVERYDERKFPLLPPIKSVSDEKFRAIRIKKASESVLENLLGDRQMISALLGETGREYDEYYKIIRNEMNRVFRKYLEHFNLRGGLVFDHDRGRLIPFVFEANSGTRPQTSDEYHNAWESTSQTKKRICHFGVTLALMTASTKVPIFICDLNGLENNSPVEANGMFLSLMDLANTKSKQQFIFNCST